MSFDWDTASKVGGTCIAAMGALVGVIYKGTHARIKKVEIAVDIKADAAELERQRDHVVKLFEENAKIRGEMTAGFATVSQNMHQMHLDIIDRLEQVRGR